MLAMTYICFFQQLSIWIGTIGSLAVAYRVSRGRQGTLKDSLGQFVPHGIVTLGLALVLLRAVKDFFY
jgi:hypothetical protein